NRKARGAGPETRRRPWDCRKNDLRSALPIRGRSEEATVCWAPADDTKAGGQYIESERHSLGTYAGRAERKGRDRCGELRWGHGNADGISAEAHGRFQATAEIDE